MKKLREHYISILFCIFLFGFIFLECKKYNHHQPIHEDLIGLKKEILQENALFQKKILLILNLIHKNSSSTELQTHFDQLRNQYKKMEWAVEYFVPHSARMINGPALPEYELAEHIELEPEGLQVLEEHFYPTYSSETKQETIRLLKKLLNKTYVIDTQFNAIGINTSQVLDALKTEINRITTLGLSGFDTPISKNNIKEQRFALEGVLRTLQTLQKNSNLSYFNKDFKDAIAYLDGKNKDNFNYIDFIKNHLNTISNKIHAFQVSENIPFVDVQSVVKKDVENLFSKNAFDANAFVPGENFRISDEKIKLGEKLFYSTLLSKDETRSCASCHHTDKAFSDGLSAPASLTGKILQRNTPSLNYSNFQHGQFWDMRREDLESQSNDVITNPDEMHGTMEEIVKKLNQNPNFRKEFQKAFPKHQNIEVWQLQNAIASYIRSLSTFSSDFDEYMRGNNRALSEVQKAGFNLFVGKANCATCHFIPLFNGTVPPQFTETDSEVLGTAVDFTNKKLSPDRGRGKYHPTIQGLQNSFKTHTLRNIAKTAPYMHNGGYKTLEQVMDFYNKGGGKAFGFKIDHQTLPADPLHLSKKEIQSIIAFLESLSDKN